MELDDDKSIVAEEQIVKYAKLTKDKEFKTKVLKKVGYMIESFRKNTCELKQNEFASMYAEKYKLSQTTVTFAETGRSGNAQKRIIEIFVKEYGAKESDFVVIQDKEGVLSENVKSLSQTDYVQIIEESNQLLREKNRRLQDLYDETIDSIRYIIETYQNQMTPSVLGELSELIND